MVTITQTTKSSTTRCGERSLASALDSGPMVVQEQVDGFLVAEADAFITGSGFHSGMGAVSRIEGQVPGRPSGSVMLR